MCAQITADTSSSGYGGFPVSRTKAEQASEYWSARPSTFLPLICSGAVKSGVPTNWPATVTPREAIVPLLSPKSDTYR